MALAEIQRKSGIPFDPPLPSPYDSALMWVKADMMCAVSFARLDLPMMGKDLAGNRIYDVRHISEEQLRMVRACLLNGIGLGSLTQHL